MELDDGLFRKEALAHHRDGYEPGRFVRRDVGWARWAYRLLLTIVAAALAFAAVMPVGEHATGPALVRVDGRVDLTAPTAAVVSAVYVHPGERVRAGQLLAQLADAAEQAELLRVQRELETQLLRHMSDPGDVQSAAAVAGLRGSRDEARARIDARRVRAPRSGVVNDVRVHAGQAPAAGELLVTLVDDEVQPSLVALLPGRFRPLLRVGMPLRFELDGFRAAWHELPITAVGDEVIGPREAQRFLGPELGDAVPLTGPLVVVRVALPGRTFASSHRHYPYYDGLRATAEVRVRTQRLLSLFWPGGEADDGR
jgi:membrane fusion protein (multidrug efflux system)